YGFASERGAFARRCAQTGLTFVGPRPELLELFGDKTRARALAARCGVPILEGTASLGGADDVRAFLSSLGAGGVAVLKAVAGGGGRGMRIVRHAGGIDDAWERRRSEGGQAFGSGDPFRRAAAAVPRPGGVRGTGRAPSPISGSASARSNAGIRSWSRLLPAPTCPPGCALGSSTRRSGWRRRSGTTTSGPSSS